MQGSGTTLGTAVAAALLGLFAVTTSGAPVDEVPGGTQVLVRIAAVGPADPVVVDGDTVQVGDRAVRFGRTVTDAAATAGGLYVLVGDELWVTDLTQRLRAGISGLARISATDGGRTLVLEHAERDDGTRVVSAFDTRNGERVLHDTVPAALDGPLHGAGRAPAAG